MYALLADVCSLVYINNRVSVKLESYKRVIFTEFFRVKQATIGQP